MCVHVCVCIYVCVLCVYCQKRHTAFNIKDEIYKVLTLFGLRRSDTPVAGSDEAAEPDASATAGNAPPAITASTAAAGDGEPEEASDDIDNEELRLLLEDTQSENDDYLAFIDECLSASGDEEVQDGDDDPSDDRDEPTAPGPAQGSLPSVTSAPGPAQGSLPSVTSVPTLQIPAPPAWEEVAGIAGNQGVEGEESTSGDSIYDAAEDLMAVVLYFITDQGSNMLSAFVDSRGTWCFCHVIHNVVKRLCSNVRFASAIRKARAFVTHVRGSLLSSNALRALQIQELKLDRPTIPQNFGETRWVAYFVMVGWMLKNFKALDMYVKDPLAGSRSVKKQWKVWNSITMCQTEWEALFELIHLLKPLHTFSLTIQSTDEPAAGILLPTLKVTIDDLEALRCRMQPEVGLIIDELVADLTTHCEVSTGEDEST
eukprot:GHVU01030171.1.p1 GENE.GHVU01030171.1~~GHVU01030171.1.p1  ORF type:complete len:428 (+),score=56.36 GHVU01030171.1:243-1526(+)